MKKILAAIFGAAAYFALAEFFFLTACFALGLGLGLFLVLVRIMPWAEFVIIWPMYKFMFQYLLSWLGGALALHALSVYLGTGKSIRSIWI